MPLPYAERTTMPTIMRLCAVIMLVNAIFAAICCLLFAYYGNFMQASSFCICSIASLAIGAILDRFRQLA